MSEYKGLFTFDEDNHRYVPIAQADGIIDTMDYEPAEPLIKDEKIRKAVRAWAEANSVKKVLYLKMPERILCKLEDTDDCDYEIDFVGHIPTLEDGEDYTIEELCGTPEPLEPTLIDLDERIKEKEEE